MAASLYDKAENYWRKRLQINMIQPVQEKEKDKQSTLAAPEGTDEWSQARSWGWIGFAFLLVFLATIFIFVPQIEQQLDRQVRERLNQAGVDASTLSFDWDYRNLNIKGYLPVDVSHRELAAIVRGSEEHPESIFFAKGIRRLRLVTDDAGLAINAATEEYLAVEVRSDGSVATLNGTVQNDVQRSQLVKALLNSGVSNVFDHVDVQALPSSQPVDVRIALLASMLNELGPTQIKDSEITMTERNLHYKITARDKHSALAIEKAASINIADFNVTGGVDVFVKSLVNVVAETDGSKITLTGKVPAEQHRKRLLFAAGEAVGGRNVIDELRVTSSKAGTTASNQKVAGIAAVVSRFAPGINGAVSLNGDELALDARVGSQAVKEYLASSTASARSVGLSIKERIVLQLPVDDSEALQLALDDLIDEVRVNVVFTSGDSVLSGEARQTLDKVAKRIGAYDDLLVEIEGHTDDVGRAAVNEKLSQDRANAVRNYLARNAVDPSRLIAVGYGHRKPLEPNDTADGRRANRRVHFTVLRRPG